MFYSHDVLNLRTGKLAIVWLAATGRIKLNKKCDSRDIMGTTIYKVCDEILKHINVQDRGLVSSLEIYPKRFSLYLSTMLMYGTVRVYNFQVIHLLDDVSVAFAKLVSGPSLARELLGTTTPRITAPSKINLPVAPNFDPLLFGTALEGDLDLFLMRLDDETDFITPRKIVKDDKLKKSATKKMKLGSQSVSEIMRENVPISDGGIIVQGEMDILLQDWEELASLHHHVDATSITLLEDIPIGHLDMSDKFTTQMEDDLGPPIFQFPQGFLGPTEKPSVQDLSEGVQSFLEQSVLSEAIHDLQTRVSEVLPMEVIPGMLPPIAETPADQLVTGRKSPLRKKKDKKRKLDPEEEITLLHIEPTLPSLILPDPAPQVQEIITPSQLAQKSSKPVELPFETPQIPRKEPDVESQPEIELQPISTIQEKHRRKLKRKHPFIDKFTQISSDNLKKQINDYSDTMRESEFYKDAIHAHWWRNMIPVDQLFHYPRKNIQSTELSYLFIRCYHSKTVDIEELDHEHKSSNGVRRELDFIDSASEGKRSPAIFAELSHIENISNLQDISSKLSSSVDKSFQSVSVTAPAQASLTEPAFVFPHFSDPKSQRPIEHEDIAKERPVKKKKLERTEDKEFIYEEAAEVHPQPPTAELTRISEADAEIFPQPSTAEFTPRIRQPSPDYGFINMTVVAEIHAPPHIQTLSETPEKYVEEQELSPGPMRGQDQFIPQALSPIIAAIPRQIVTTPESRRQRHLSLLFKHHNLRKAKLSSQLTLVDFLPPNATRSDVATVFADLLGLHKKRHLSLSQKENYGDIVVTKLGQ